MRWLLKRPAHFLGLHLTDEAVYWVNIQSTEALPMIQHASTIKSNTVNTIKKALLPILSTRPKIILSIPAHKMLTKTLSVPTTQNDLDVLEKLKANSRHYFPEITAPLCFEFNALAPHETNLPERNLQVFAVKQDEITHRIQLSKSLGLHCMAIEPDHCALLRLIKRALGKEKTTPTFIYLIVMKFLSRLFCFHEQSLLLNQTVPTCHLTQQFASFLQQCRLLLPTSSISPIYFSPPQSTLENNLLSPHDNTITSQLTDPLNTFRFENREFCTHPNNLYQEPFQIALGLALRGHDARP